MEPDDLVALVELAGELSHGSICMACMPRRYDDGFVDIQNHDFPRVTDLGQPWKMDVLLVPIHFRIRVPICFNAPSSSAKRADVVGDLGRVTRVPLG